MLIEIIENINTNKINSITLRCDINYHYKRILILFNLNDFNDNILPIVQK